MRGMKIEFRLVYFFIFATGSKTFFVPSWLMMSLWFADDFLGLLLTMDDDGGGTAFGAHVGGFLFGLGLAYATRGKIERGEFESKEKAPLEVTSDLTMRTVFVHFNDRQHGPFPVHEVWHRVRQGEIPADALYWTEERQQWLPVGEL